MEFDINDVLLCDRVVAPGSNRTIGPHTFINWGAHSDHYPCAYLTAAAAIGMTRGDVDTFLKRLDKTLLKFKRKHRDRQEETTRNEDEEDKTD